MDFDPSENQLAIRAAVEETCAAFDDEYWLKKDREGITTADPVLRCGEGAGPAEVLLNRPPGASPVPVRLHVDRHPGAIDRRLQRVLDPVADGV